MSHFSTIKTQLKKAEPLIKALNHFGYQIVEEKNKNDGSIELVLTKWDN